MKKVRKIFCMGVVSLAASMLGGCERMTHGPAENLPAEVTTQWINEVHAEQENNSISMIQEAPEPTPVPEAMSEVTQEPIPEFTAAPSATLEPVPTPEPEVYEFTVSEKEYFSDALFIGDSRTMGLQLYGTLDNADYFAAPGLSLYAIPRTKVDVGEYQEIGLTELLEKKEYGKIYLMLGINELGYDFDRTLEKYHEMVELLRTQEPEAVLYLCANLHVTGVRDALDEVHNNERIDKINAEISTLADRKDIFYLDINVLFDDEEGNLSEEVASDDSHVLGAYYADWCTWLEEHTIVKENT